MSTSPEDSPQSLYQKSSEGDILPLILDPSQSPTSVSDLVERVHHGGGLLADTGLSAVLLSMSNYGKTYVESEGYETTNSTDMYLAYTPQAMNPPPHLRGPFNRDEDQSYTPYDSVGITQQDESWQQSSESQQIPEIIDWSPKFGSQGTRIIINLRSTFAINTTTMNLSVKFGSVKSSASILTTLKADSTYFKYALHAEAPSHGLTGWNSQQVPIVVMAHDQSGIFITSLKLGGLFSYNSTAGILQASPNLSRKRRLSESDEVVIDFPPKRVATMPVKMDSNYNNDRSFVAFDEQNESYVQSPSHLGMATSMGSNYNRPILHTGDLHRGSPNQLHQQIDPTIPTQPRHAPSHVRSWSSSNLPGMFSRSPNMSGNMRRVNTMNTSSIATNPRLVRTSQISQAPSPASTPTVAPLSGNFSPYAVHPHKAQLKISGELDTMTQSWTPEECDVKRRLVQFWRSQTGSAITTTFAPVAPENRQPNAICISCIWWEEKDQYYVTSVDTIFLLESLVAVRFTVEEKNRIRRNLEGFRPLTVSKGKADSEDFFKLIMGFPNPKPRNIEKDVKVYPWTILALALKKIIGKYSASYSSIASSMGPAMNSFYSAHDISNEMNPSSPHSTTDSTLSMTYHSPMTTATTSTSVPSDIHNHQTSAAGGNYTSSTMLPNTIAPSYPLYSYPQAQPNHSSSLLSYATPQQSSSSSSNQSHGTTHRHSQPSSWDSTISLQPSNSVYGNGIYNFGNNPSHNGTDQYQMTPSNSGT